MDKEKFIKKVRSVNPGNYWINFPELIAIVEANSNQAVDCTVDGFLYGFLKGQRAAKKKR